MADDVDRAQEAEQQHRDDAIARVRIAQSFVPRDPRVDDDCIDCGEAIEAGRRRLLSTSRCARCAHAFEEALRRGR